jgi:2-methylcitrate dehydratase PrpD
MPSDADSTGHRSPGRRSSIDRWYPERYANRVEVVLKNGQRFETRIDFARGSVERPIAFPEAVEKFRSLAGYAFTVERAERIIEAVERTEALDNVRDLTGLLG